MEEPNRSTQNNIHTTQLRIFSIFISELITFHSLISFNFFFRILIEIIVVINLQ